MKRLTLVLMVLAAAGGLSLARGLPVGARLLDAPRAFYQPACRRDDRSGDANRSLRP